jgi:hypothetical protein
MLRFACFGNPSQIYMNSLVNFDLKYFTVESLNILKRAIFMAFL